jgi:hypothetical protein
MTMHQTANARRVSALQLVEADLDHLERAICQPATRMLDAHYWRRRVLSVRREFELTHEQGARVDEILRRLAERGG